MHVHEDFGYEFLRIPHFLRNPFYCYSYTFAHLVALSLYEQYQQEGQSFVPKYEKLLGYGRSRPVDEVFLELGIDIRSPEFWQSGFDFLDRQVKELEQLV